MGTSGATPFPVILGDLLHILVGKSQDLLFMTREVNNCAGLEPLYHDRMLEMGARVARLREFTGLMERWIPHENDLRALADHNPIPELVDYVLVGGNDRVLDGEECLLRTRADCDMGPVVRFDFGGSNGRDLTTRYATFPRDVVLAVRRRR